MQALQSQSFVSSDSTAMDDLHDFLRQRRQVAEPLEDFDQIEQELHRLFVAAEREALGRELERFDLNVPRIEIDGERYDQVLPCETTYNSAVGPVRVERSLYRHPSGGRSVCPLEIEAGIMEGYWTPLAAKQLPAMGYGLRYEYGIFKQSIQDGWQHEEADNWLRHPDPWEVAQPHDQVEVRLNCSFEVRGGTLHAIPGQPSSLLGIPFDRPVVGYGGKTINTLRLWSAAVPELIRILLDGARLDWDQAWDLTRRTLAYTNHTLLPEALEKWPLAWFELLLPRHLEISLEINRRLLEVVRQRFPGDAGRIEHISLVEEGAERKIRMANLAIVGSHSTNGVAAIHSELLRTTTVKDLAEMFPERFNNKTNGVTPRCWLKSKEM